MDSANIKRRIKNLNKIEGIVEIAKFDTIQKLSEATNVSGYHYEASKLAKDVITYTTTKYHMTKKLSKKAQERGKLFIYITIPSSMMKVSYDKLNGEVDAIFDRTRDAMIAVGNPAMTFAKKKRYEVVHQYEDLKETSFGVESIVNSAISKQTYSEIIIVARMRRNEGNKLTIFPFSKDDDYNKKQFNKTKFFSSISNTFENISNSYVRNIIKGVYQETYMLFYKQKLMRHEDSLKRIEQVLEDLKLELVKLNRKKETEDMILVSEIAKG